MGSRDAPRHRLRGSDVSGRSGGGACRHEDTILGRSCQQKFGASCDSSARRVLELAVRSLRSWWGRLRSNSVPSTNVELLASISISVYPRKMAVRNSY